MIDPAAEARETRAGVSAPADRAAGGSRSHGRSALLLVLGDPSGDPRPKRAFDRITAMGMRVDIASHPIDGRLDPVRHVEITRPTAGGFPARIARKLTALLCKTLLILPLPFPIVEVLLALRYRFWALRRHLSTNAYDLILVEDLFLLPVAVRRGSDARIFFDAREFYPRQHEDQRLSRVFDYPVRDRICRKYLPECDRFFTVSPGLRDGYLRTYGVSAQVIRSTPELADLPVVETDPARIRMVHHGVANANRRLELMIDLVRCLDSRYTLDFFLTGNKDYVKFLKHRAHGLSQVRFRDPVSLEALVPTLARYDIGLFFFEPTTFNLAHCLPNKLFEFIQARLAVVVGPVPDMAHLVRERACGIVADSFDIRELARKMKDLTPREIDGLKKNSDLAARELNWGREGLKLEAAINEVLTRGDA